MSDQDKSRSKLQEQFAKAHDGLVTPPVSEAPKRERISATYELEGTHGSEKLDKASANLREQFNRAANPKPPEAAPERAEVGPRGPAPAPAGMAYKPSGSLADIRREVDGKEFTRQLADLQANHVKRDSLTRGEQPPQPHATPLRDQFNTAAAQSASAQEQAERNRLKELNKAAKARSGSENDLQSKNDRTRDTERGQ